MSFSRGKAGWGLVAALLLAACGGEAPEPAPVAPAGSPESLKAHSEELRRDVIAVTDTVTVAVGFGLANSILVEGPTCAFIVDTTESREIAAEILDEFRKRTDKAIGAIIYTHNHTDHIFGAEIFAADIAAAADLKIYAHATTAAAVDNAVNIIRPTLAMRSARMFGTYLVADEELVNAGLGPRLGVTGPDGGSIGYLPPTIAFDDRLETEICGREVVLEHAPGETNDQIFVWLPDEKVVLPGDNIYRAFPNLYTIRGTRYRDVKAWAASLDRIRALGPAHLVPSHTRPVSGAGEIDDVLLAYADGIRFGHDQTVRGMNLGLSPDELVAFVDLPPHLKSHPFLQEHYGTVRWSVRSIYSGYLGWFDGEGAHLEPASPKERAETLARLAAEETSLTDAAAVALTEGRNNMAAELAHLALVADPRDDRARRVKADALNALALTMVSPNGRNYLLTQARELRGALTIDEGKPDERSLSFTRNVPIANFMAALPVSLDAAAAQDIERTAEFRFADTGETFTVEIRRGVAVVSQEPAATPDIVIDTDSLTWIDLLIGRRRAAGAIASGDLSFPGGLGDLAGFARFMGYFTPA